MLGDVKKSWLYKLRPRHFLTQVNLLTALAIILSTTILTAYQVTKISQFQYENSLAVLSAIANNVDTSVRSSLMVKDYGNIEQLLLHSANFPGITSLTVTNPSGSIISAVERMPGQAIQVVYSAEKRLSPASKSSLLIWTYGSSLHANPLLLGLDATELTLLHPLEKGELGWLHLSFSVSKVQEEALLLIRNGLIFALSSLLIFILVLSYLLKPALRAIAEATIFARGLNTIAGQQFNTHTGSVELEQLVQVLNETSSHLYLQDAEFKKSNALLSNVLAAASEISIVATDKQGLITLFNSGAERLLGYTAAEVINTLTPIHFLLPAEVSARARELSDTMGYAVEGFKALTHIAEKHGSEQGEWTYVKKSGELVPVSRVVTTMRDEAGSIIGYLGIAQDISERLRNDKIKSEFVSTVSHELRTPLTAISGALGLMSGGALGEMPEAAKLMLAIAYKNSQRLSFLINDLLDMEKLAAGKMHFDMKQQLLMPLIEQAVDENKTYGIDRRIKIALSHVEPDALIWVDSHRLLQVFANLLSNAIKYSPDEGTVAVAVHLHKNTVRISVRDNGHGIPQEFHKRIFGKFTQADSSDTRQKGGTGLGLAITRELVQRMNGYIGFDSIEGQGCTFYVDLPLSYVQAANIDPSTPASKNSSPRILVVEDDEDIAKLLSIMLTRAGYTVDIALNGGLALEALERTKYTAITLDLMLPDISGLEVIRRLRAQAKTAEIPIIVVSAKMEEGRLNISNGIKWLAKPIDETALLAAISQTHATNVNSI